MQSLLVRQGGRVSSKVNEDEDDIAVSIHSSAGLNFVPGSIVVVSDATWLVTSTETTTSGLLIRVHGSSELVGDTTASFYSDIDTMVPLNSDLPLKIGSSRHL